MVSMNDVAAKAGVSQATVSFVLNNRHRDNGSIGEDTRRRVLEAAADLGYRRNELSRSMTTGKSRMIGFVVSARYTEFEARMMNGVLDEAQAHDYTVKVFRVQDLKTHRATMERCAELRLAGVIALLLPEEVLDALRSEMDRAHIPMVLLDSSFFQPGDLQVCSDDQEGARQAVEYLVGLGHSRIGFLGGLAGATQSGRREAGYREAMQKHGLPVPDGYVDYTDWKIDPTVRATERLFVHPEGRPTGIVCATDSIAAIVLRTAARTGLRVPQELSVVGYGGFAMVDYVEPPLTTVAQPFEAMGKAAAQLLMGCIRSIGLPEAAVTPEDRLFTPELVVRESTAPAPTL